MDTCYAIYTVSESGNRKFLEGGFKTEEAAWERAEEYGWAYTDENGYECGLEIDTE